MSATRPVATAAGIVVGGVIMLIIGNINNSLLDWGEQSEQAASRAKVATLQRRVDGLPGPQELRRLTAELSQFNQSLADIRSDLRLARSHIDNLQSTQNGLTTRQRVLWDRVTTICIKQDIACATRNAIWRLMPPNAAPRLVWRPENQRPSG